jgi:hypothetical protein
VSLLAVAAACVGSGRGGAETSPSGPPTCEVRFTVPAGFRVTESFEDPYPDHVGVRMGFRDPRRRELHYFAGIPGEFGEGLPLGRRVAVTTGEQARLLGEGDVWVLAWETSGPCAAHAVLGRDFTREEFLRMMVDSGVVSG